MKKLLFIFLIGQMLLVSYIFNKSIYDIFELNNLGDSSLNKYQMEDFSGDSLSKLYDNIHKTCLNNDRCRLQIVKTPLSDDNKFIYDIYHSHVDELEKPNSISDDTEINYHLLTKEEFVDSNGAFYTDYPIENLNDVMLDIGIRISGTEEHIAYSQVLMNNSMNFSILLLLSQLVLFFYTFTRIKINAVKQMLGFTKFKIILDSLFEFVKLEAVCLVSTFFLHGIYYFLTESIVLRILFY